MTSTAAGQRLPAAHGGIDIHTSARRNSSSSARRALTSIVPDLTCLLVMVCILAKDPVIAHHAHTMTIRPQRLLQNLPDTTCRLVTAHVETDFREGMNGENAPINNQRGKIDLGQGSLGEFSHHGNAGGYS
jgi:hypothetical protein